MEHVFRDTLDTSLRAGVAALRELCFRAYAAERAASKFRKHEEQILRDTISVRHDRKQLINVARERIRQLEEQLRADFEDPLESRDLGWDNETLRADLARASADSAARPHTHLSSD